MATFGSFETVLEVYYGPTYAVYSARKSGDPKTEYAIKVFFLLPANLATESDGKAAPMLDDIRRSYIERVSLQQQTAAVSKFVAPILETGHDERGVWYATRFYGRSVNKMMNGRLAPNRQTLQHILRGLAQGALDLKRVCGRSHGEILPTNIQISRSENILEAEVVLSDPLPGNESDAARYELADLRSIGQLLLHLVLRRLISPEDDYLILPILSSPDWTQVFGKDADRWLAMCNRLLDPNLSLDQYSLEQLLAELEEIKPKSRVPVKLLLATASALVALAIGAVVVQKRMQLQAVDITSDPTGATILIGQKETGRTPFTLRLAPGTHAIAARQDALHLADQSTNWLVQPGSPSKLQFQFPYGSVALQSIPSGATVIGNGITLGRTPADGSALVIPILPPGQVRYQFNLDRHESTNVVGVVVDHQRLVMNATLREVVTNNALLPVQKITETKATIAVAPVAPVVPIRVMLDSAPSGATVWVGTNLIGTTPTNAVLQAAGLNTFRFELADFETTNLSIAVPASPALPLTVKTALTPTKGLFELSADPAEATILDASGRTLGQTSPGKPLKITAAPGTYIFTARVDGLTDVTASFKLEKRELKKHTFHFEYGRVRMESKPSGASVFAADKNIGVTPMEVIQRTGSRVTYSFSAPEHQRATNEVTVRGPGTITNLVTLMPELVRVVLTSEPEGAQFFSEGKLVENSLPLGTHTIIAKHARHPWIGNITNVLVVKKGATNTLPFKFNYGRVEFVTTPPGADIYEGTNLIARTPTNLYFRAGRFDYELVFDNRTNRVGTNLIPGAVHRLSADFASADFELNRGYTNSAGMEFVRVKDGFYVGRFEVTEAQYQRITGGTTRKPNMPKVNVSWDDAKAFCQKLSQMDAATMATAKLASWNYSLPTEMEWLNFIENDPDQIKEAVFAIPSATIGQRPEGPGSSPLDIGRVTRSAGPSLAPGSTASLNLPRGPQEPKEIDFMRRSTNRFGIFDLFGNVAEWGSGADGKPLTTGGSFKDKQDKAAPWKFPPSVSAIDRKPRIKGDDHIGFRCIIKPPMK